MEKILVVDDNVDIQFLLASILEEKGFEVIKSGTGENALKEAERHNPRLVLLDLGLPDMDGLGILEKLKEKNRNIIVIMITASNDTKHVVKAMKAGAFDYIPKPFNNDELIFLIRRALENNLLPQKNLVRNIPQPDISISQELVGNSFPIKKILNHVRIISPTNLTIVLQGESGTGKEMMARLIHQNSLRKDKPFVAVDCGSIPESLAESELFGFEKGSFTGASAAKEGKFEMANGGTLFLDEINNLPIPIQMKFLRAIQERTIQRVGGKKEIYLDVRIIAATNINLLDTVNKKGFRNDLFYRLNEFTINLPSLSERKEDIPLLAQYFLNMANREFHKNIKGFSVEVMNLFVEYPWPGNIRELKNIIRKTVILTDSDLVTTAFLPNTYKKDTSILPVPANLKLPNDLDPFKNLEDGLSFEEITKKIESHLIKNALNKSGGNKIKAAELLKINQKTFYRKMKNLGL